MLGLPLLLLLLSFVIVMSIKSGFTCSGTRAVGGTTFRLGRSLGGCVSSACVLTAHS